LTTVARSAPTGPAALQRRGRFRIGDAFLYGLTAVAGFAAVILLILITWKVLAGAQLSWDTFGLGFLTDTTWDPNKSIYGAGLFLFGTALTSFFALLVAGPIAIAIALFLTELAPPWVRAPVGALVEMLASIPSVILGLWGILVMGPWVVSTLSPILSTLLDWTPFFDGKQTVGSSQLSAVLILTIMVVPIVASICRELFTNVPTDLKEGALALGATRWEMIRGVVFPYSRAGVAAALILGLGRAVGEAIAVTQVIGSGTHISFNLFATGDTLGSKIAAMYASAGTDLERSSLVYLAVLLLVFSLIVNMLAQVIVRRVARRQQGRS
jgi:phosphate transport system permease protein